VVAASDYFIACIDKPPSRVAEFTARGKNAQHHLRPVIMMQMCRHCLLSVA
jgi:hypothetical protein